MLIEELFRALAYLNGDFIMRQEMSSREQALIDGLGAVRIAETIVGYIKN